MILGFDIDNVIADFDKVVMEEIKKSGKKVVKTNTPLYSKRFNWTQQEKSKYFKDNIENLCKILPIRKNVRKVLGELIKSGNEIILISFRNNSEEFGDLTNTTVEWLEKHKVPYTTLVISTGANKTEECKKYNVDVFLDDRVDAVIEMRNNGINAIAMKTRYNGEEIKQTKNAQSWLDYYHKLKIGEYTKPLI